MRSPRLLVLTRHSPLPWTDGAGAYLWDLLHYFRQRGVSIQVAWTMGHDEWPRQNRVWLPESLAAVAQFRFPSVLSVGRWHWFTWGGFKAVWLHRAKSLLPQRLHRSSAATMRSSPAAGVPSPHTPTVKPFNPWAALPSARDNAFFQDCIRRFRPDVVLANFCWLTPSLPNGGAIRTAVLTHDVMSMKLPMQTPELAQHPQVPNPARAEGEAVLLQRAQDVFAISPDDAEVMKTLVAGNSRVTYVPKAAVRSTRRSSASAEAAKSPVVLMVGSRNRPNQQGLRWFLQDVWPLVLSNVPAAQFHVAGKLGEDLPPHSPQTRALGFVRDLEEVYSQASVVIVPLLQGTGVKIKLVEAASQNAAIVTTSVGLQGLDFLRGAVRENDAPAAFASDLAQLLGDPAARAALGEAVGRAVDQHLSPKACYEGAFQALFGR